MQSWERGYGGPQADERAPRLRLDWLTPGLCVWLGGLMGLATYLLTFPLGAVFSGADAFGFEPDQMQHISTIRYFAWDEWRWPLFLAQPMAAPEGSIIVFSDGLPLYSLLVRLLRGIVFWPDSNFLGLWLAFCYALQGVAAVAALRMAGARRPAVLLLGAVFALTLPSFVLRFSHTPLCTQGVILLGLGLYFYGRRSGEGTRALLWGLLLCWVTLLINAYLYVMVSALFGALLLATVADRTVKPLRAAVLLALHLGLSLAIMAAGGYLAEQGTAGSGFGYYSWNPLSLLVPQESFLFPGLPLVDSTGGQYEGFSYLGLGLLSAVLASLFAARQGTLRAARRHWPLLLAVGALLLLALSNKVWFGAWLLLDLGEPPRVLGALRSSGRMVWVLLYLLIVAVLLTLPRRWGRAGIAVLCASALLQVLDSQGYREDIGGRVANAAPNPFPATAWEPLLAGRELVELVPDFSCAREERTRVTINLAVYRASAMLVPATTAYVARSKPRNCSTRPAEAVFQRTLEPGRVLLLMGLQDNVAKLAVSSAGVRDADRLCRLFRFGVACAHDWPQDPAVDAVFQPQALSDAELFPAIRLGTSFEPALQGEVTKLMGPGWGETAEGAWTLNGVAYLVIRPEQLPSSGMEVAIEALLPARPGVEEQELWVTINGKELGRWRQAPSDEPFRAALRFSNGHATPEGLFLIGLHNARPWVPAERPATSSITLGLRIDKVTIGAQP